jgi:hypothetical protein
MEETGSTTVNIDLSGTENALNKIVETLSGDEKTMLKEIAIRLYANSDFEHTSKSAAQLADVAIERAMILASKLPK